MFGINITETIIMTCIANYPSKKAFKEAAKVAPWDVSIEDPSIMRPCTFRLVDLRVGETIFVTNHPKRSWFAEAGRKVDGSIYIK